MRGLPFFGVFLIALPLIEIFTFVSIGAEIGALATVLLVILTAFAGAALMARHGRTMMIRLQSAVAAGRPPALEMIDGTLAWFGALFLVIPGFVTDAIGLLLLLPPIRFGLAAWALRRVFVVSTVSGGGQGPKGPRQGPRVIETDWRRDDDQEK